MVRGRRVRAVVNSGIGDCLSPKSKRINGTNGTITAYFQNVNNLETKPLNNKNKSQSSLIIDLDCEKFASYNDTELPKSESFNVKLEKLSSFEDQFPTTPIMTDKISNTKKCESPTNLNTTPHKILCPNVQTKENQQQQRETLQAKPTKDSNKKAKNLNSIGGNHQLTDYFPIRRSERKCKKAVLEEKQKTLELLLRHEIEDGLEVRKFKEKGRGIVASRPFGKGDFVVEYSGDLIDMAEAKRRELKYSQDHSTGCYMYYFKHNDQQYCVDATAESGKLGRLVNHSRNGNLITRTVSVDNKPRLILIAKDDIQSGEEITYDYGDRSKESLQHHPWLAY